MRCASPVTDLAAALWGERTGPCRTTGTTPAAGTCLAKAAVGNTMPIQGRRLPTTWLGERSIDTELVALDVQHRDAGIVAVIQRLHVYRTERDQSRAFGLKRGEALLTHESGADPHIKMHPVL